MTRLVFLCLAGNPKPDPPRGPGGELYEGEVYVATQHISGPLAGRAHVVSESDRHRGTVVTVVERSTRWAWVPLVVRDNMPRRYPSPQAGCIEHSRVIAILIGHSLWGYRSGG